MNKWSALAIAAFCAFLIAVVFSDYMSSALAVCSSVASGPAQVECFQAVNRHG